MGVLWRKQWGRILALLMASLTILMGLLSLALYLQTRSEITILIAFGAAEILYGVLTFVILLKNSADFSRPQ